MANIEIKAEQREEVGNKARKVRRRGLIPAVLYGHKFASTAISVEAKEFQKKVLASGAGRNLIFTLKLNRGGQTESVAAITQTIQRDCLTDQILHLDFLHIMMDEAIKTRVPVELLGMPTGVKDDGGVLVHGLRAIEIKCLPGDIPDKFEINVAGLKINDALHVSDLKISDKITILSPATEMIAIVSAPTKEEEVVPVAAVPVEGAVATEAAAGAAPTEEAKPAAAGKEKGAAAPAAPQKGTAGEKKEKK
ncbi:MAG: 50S ribosomal protein L25 [Candidatus Margulisiibacteriota bacterium]